MNEQSLILLYKELDQVSESNVNWTEILAVFMFLHANDILGKCMKT